MKWEGMRTRGLLGAGIVTGSAVQMSIEGGVRWGEHRVPGEGQKAAKIGCDVNGLCIIRYGIGILAQTFQTDSS